ncbi:Na(+)/H(+) antiporter subunit B [Anaeromicrobium sediminis]|uniref:MrpA C-terminal/MbhD domain-containing protein n=1 Tax=Anaeromicrobium sediminis TaxID=1478221 RepID=A0A267MEM8_9FIRM|nr:DUF4040 domain-containing protein [Anaeromicrobium sediminis]PAB57260.1 hypothetical protein CCE28_19445 [Anaeromicrobium sediminis]
MNMMNIVNLLSMLLILISITIIISKDNLKLIVFFSAFSLISASLYYLYKSPDVALAEVAIGSAIIPLIFIISISKQREFVVISHVDDDFLRNCGLIKGVGYRILEDFTNYYGLKLSIYSNDIGKLYGIFRQRDVDLIIDKCPNTENYLIKGKESSILMNKLEQITEKYDRVVVLKVREGETYD